jgi:tetratricopeptide (TPR) repeat protein
MPENHPDPQLLERFMRNEVDGEERRRIVRHLLGGCAQCVGVTRPIWALGEGRPEDPLPEDLLENPPERPIPSRPSRPDGGNVGRVSRRLAEVLEFPRAERRERIGADERFQSPALCELLMASSRQAGPSVLAIERAEAAVDVAERLDPGRYGEPFARALGLRAWTCLGSVRRLAGDPRGAAEALKQAEPMLVEGEDLLEEAELHELAACLEADQGGLEEAEHRLDRALALARSLGERHLEGRILVRKGTIRGWLQGEGPAGQGIEWLEEGLDRLDAEREPAFMAFALHRLALLLAEGKRRELAILALQRARLLYRRLGDEPNLVRLRHLEGKIGEAAGAPREAEAAFLDARKGFVGAGLGVEAAGALLDLAMLYTREGRAPEIRPYAEDLLPIFRAPDLRQGVAAALLFFRRLVETEHADLEALSAVAYYVNGPPRERRPGLR